MILGISSLGQRTSTSSNIELRERTRAFPAALHALGATLGGAANAGLLWILLTPVRTLLPGAVLAALVTSAVVVCVLSDMEVVGFGRLAVQPPQSWLGRFGPSAAFFRYGISLGAGLFTAASYHITWLIFLAPALTLPLFAAIAVGALFGLGRALLVLPLSLLERRRPRLAPMLGRDYRLMLSTSAALCVLFGATVIAWRLGA